MEILPEEPQTQEVSTLTTKVNLLLLLLPWARLPAGPPSQLRPPKMQKPPRNNPVGPSTGREAEAIETLATVSRDSSLGESRRKGSPPKEVLTTLCGYN